MFIEKAYNTKNEDLGGLETILFATLEDGMNMSGLNATDFKMCAVICYNDGDIFSIVNPKDVLGEYEKSLEMETDMIDGLPRENDEVYIYENDEMLVMKKTELENYFNIINLFG